jgi:hypothetical protein
MPIGCFIDKTHPPSAVEVAAALGTLEPIWQRLIRFMLDAYQLPPEWSYGGPKYGWNLWYRRAGKALLTLYPQQGGCVAQVVLGKDQVEKALSLDLGEGVAKVFRETPSLHDGRWLFIPVQSERDAVDVEQLIRLKRRPVKKE